MRPRRVRHAHRWWALLTCCFLMASMTWASEELPSEVAPDRPDVTNSTTTVAPGAFQMEFGLEYRRSPENDSPAERRLTVQTTLRAGLSDRFEVRLDGEPLVRLRQEQDDLGLGDLMLGLKYRFFDPPEGRGWPSLGTQAFVKIPTASQPIGSGRTDLGVLGLATQPLPWELTLDVNAGLVAAGQPHGYLLQGLASASLSREILERLSPFIEMFFASRDERDGHDTLGLDSGVIYLLTRRVALDRAVETTLNRPRLDYAMRAGVSLRFGR
jgi:Putative MetA-pathway of phenol degradation